MRLFGRFFRLVWGDDVPRPLRPVLAVQFFGSVAMSGLWTYIGIWAIERLDASSFAIGLTFTCAAVAATATGYLGGHLSDHVGRKPLILLGFGLEAVFVLGYLAAGDRLFIGLTLVVIASALGSLGQGADQALIADLVPPERHEQAYASVRVASNLGVVVGPPIGGLLLLGDDWNRLFVGIAILAAFAFLVGVRFLPARGEYSPESPPERGSFGVIRKDRPFLLFLVSSALAYLIYLSYETVLPISAVDTHGLSPSTWGFLVIINPALVTFFQLRLTRRLAHVPAGPKLAVAMVLMGFPFLLLSLDASIPVFAFVIFVFVVGEMLWVPTSQGIAARLAPEDVRGAYMGAFSATGGFAFAVGPLVGLTLRDVGGDVAAWSFFAAAAVVAAITGAVAVQVAVRRGAKEPQPVPA
ncbi:MAG TPA: MFS transporter [Gaiellaceae bacterium]|nr:MFS transporter [Gaiellaceae bacterium]